MTDQNTLLAWSKIRAELSAIQYRTLTWIHLNPGSTRNEIDRGLSTGEAVNATFSRRLAELERRGLLKRGPSRVCSVSGHRAATYEAVVAEPGPRPKPKMTPGAALAAIRDALTIYSGKTIISEVHGQFAADATIDRVREIVAEFEKGRAA